MSLVGLTELLIRAAFNAGMDRKRSAKDAGQSASDGVLLGHAIEDGGQQEVRLTSGERARHTYLIGSTGSGKTNCLLRLIEDDIARRDSFIVVDLRGDLVDRILSRVASSSDSDLANRLTLIDLRQDEWITGFNPLLGEGEVQARALHLLGILKRHAESWGVQLDETLRNSLIALAEVRHSIVELEPLLTNQGFREEVLREGSDPAVRSFFSRFDSLTPEARSSWTGPVLNKLGSFLAIPRVRLTLGSGESIRLGELLNLRGQVILISLGVDRLREAAHLVGSLLIHSIEAAVLGRVDLTEEDRVPVRLYVDEFETMASPSFEAIIAEGRRFGLSLILSHQNLSQLDTRLSAVIRNNVQCQLYFQTGVIDAGSLAGEVVGLGSKEDVKELLLSQNVGEALLVRRGQPSLPVRVLPCPDPEVLAAKVADLRLAALRRCGRGRIVIEEEISGRVRERSAANPREVRDDSPPLWKH